jgi:hypothetical protein
MLVFICLFLSKKRIGARVDTGIAVPYLQKVYGYGSETLRF